MITQINGIKIMPMLPHNGGCFFCCTEIENFYMYYSREFDCYVHRDCLFHAVEKEKSETAKIILNELKLKER